MEAFDLVVIGAGPGGYPAAIRAAQLGASVALVEKAHLGGTCLNWGCIPTKTLIAGAASLAAVRHGAVFGLVCKEATLDYTSLTRHKNRVIDQLRQGVKQLLAANQVRSYEGTATFRDRHTVMLGNGTSLSGKWFIIATGSVSALPDQLPRHPRIGESRAFLELEQLPGSLLVMGGGYIGCELACLAAALGAKVTIVEVLDDILLQLDPDVRREVRGNMERNLGIRVLVGRALEDIAADASGASGRWGEERLEAEYLLCAVGRKPMTAGLGLEAAGVQVGPRGFIETDACGLTSVANIFAVGDVTGKTQLAHYATAQGVAAAENALGSRPRPHDTCVPSVIFTFPEIGTVGLSEIEAKRQNLEVITGKFRFGALGRAVAVNETSGFVKWIADSATHQLLGAAAVGAHATELIAQATTAIRAELTVEELGRTIHPHPTFSEAWMEAAHAVYGEAIHAPPKRKAAS